MEYFKFKYYKIVVFKVYQFILFVRYIKFVFLSKDLFEFKINF